MQGWRQVRCTYICTLSAASRPSNDLYLAAAHGTEIVLKMSGWSGRSGGYIHVRTATRCDAMADGRYVSMYRQFSSKRKIWFRQQQRNNNSHDFMIPVIRHWRYRWALDL